MKTKQSTTRRLGLALACGAITLANPAMAGKPVKPPPPPPEPALTYTLYPFDDGGMPGSRAVNISAAGLVPGFFECEFVPTDETPWVVGLPMLGTFTDGDGDGILDLPRLLPVSPVDDYFAGRAFDVNEGGMVVGQTQRFVPPDYLTQYTPYQQAVIWRWDGTSGEYLPQRLGVIDWRLDESYAHRINGNGVVAGRCNSWAGAGGAWQQAFVIEPAETPEGGMTWFRDEDADGVNDLMMRIWPGPGAQYLPWSDDESIFEPPNPSSLIRDLNDSGAVCGVIESPWVSADNPYVKIVFVVVPDFGDADGDGNPWFAADAEGNNSLVRVLTGLTGGTPNSVVAINALGEVAGATNNHAVLWKPVAGGGYAIQDLGTVSERDYLSVHAMSDSSSQWLVGKAYSSAYDSRGRPLKNPLPDLLVVWWNGELLLPSLTNGASWTGLDFNDVNDAGVLAGYGVFNGKNTACLAVPNLP